MTTKATRDVLDMSIRPVQDFILDGTGVSSIDGTPIGVNTPDVGFFTNATTGNFTVTGTANFTGATVIGLSSYYADVAEYYEADEPLEPGTVVKIGGDKEITKTNLDGEEDIFGVISTAPAYVMNQQQDDSGNFEPVILVGRGPCKVVGAVKKGARLVASSNAGIARAQKFKGDGEPFARALADDDNTRERLIEVAIVTVK